MTIIYCDSLTGVDWEQLKADRFDNGRSPAQLRLSFENSFAVSLAVHDNRIIGTARVFSDGVCNAYLVNMWTHSSHRHKGIATTMFNHLCRCLLGQHLYLQVDAESADFYCSVGFTEQQLGMSRTIGTWLVNSTET